MKKRLTKWIFFVAKVSLAILLLVWVLSKVYWNDYVLARPQFGGESYSVLEILDTPHGPQLKLQRGMWWWRSVEGPWPIDRFEPLDEKQTAPPLRAVLRPGFARSIEELHWPLFILAIFAFPVCLLIVAYRFWFLLKSQGIRISLWEAVRLTFLGQFFNMVVPGTVGGDVVKAWYISKHTHRTAGVIVTIFLDRLIGLIELVLMAAVMLAFVLGSGLESYEQMRTPVMTVLIAAVMTSGAMFFLMSDRLRRLFHLQKIYQRLPIAHHLKAAGKSIRIYRRRPQALIWALITTLLSHIFFIGGIAMIGLALRIDTPVYSYFVYLPLIYIIGAVPITPGGVGWVENLYVEFFRSAAIGASAIVALAMFARVIPVFWGLPGLLVAIRGPRLPKAAQMQAELEKAQAQEQS